MGRDRCARKSRWRRERSVLAESLSKWLEAKWLRIDSWSLVSDVTDKSGRICGICGSDLSRLGVLSLDESVFIELVEISIGAMAAGISGVRLALATDLSSDPVNHWCVRACLNVIDCCILSCVTGPSVWL